MVMLTEDDITLSRDGLATLHRNVLIPFPKDAPIVFVSMRLNLHFCVESII